MSDLALLHVVRESSYYGRSRGLRVLLDDAELGAVGNDDRAVFEVPAGEHTIAVRMDWVKSDPVTFRCEPGAEVVAFCDPPECASTIWRLLFAGPRRLMTEPFRVRVAERDHGA